MGELGDLLERIFEPRFVCISARVSTSIDLEGQRRALERHGVGVVVGAIGVDPAGPPPSTIDRVVDIWFHRDGRYRLDYGGGSSVIGDGEDQVMLRPGDTALRVDGASAGWSRERVVVEPVHLFVSYHLSLDGS